VKGALFKFTVEFPQKGARKEGAGEAEEVDPFMSAT